MKSLALFLLFLVAPCTVAQISIQGKILDQSTKEPVIAASIAVKNTAIGTVANEEGEFQLRLASPSEVIVSSIGYKTRTVSKEELVGDHLKIMMEVDDQLLEEVIVMNVPIQVLLEDLMKNSSKRFNKPIVLNTYYREFVKQNGKYTKFADGLIDYHVSGTSDKLSTEAIVIQNRSAKIADLDEGSAFDAGSPFGVSKVTKSTYGLTYINSFFIKKKAYKNYDFLFKSIKTSDGKPLIKIIIDPKPGIEELLYQASITYDPETKLIYNIQANFSPDHAQFSKTLNVLLFKLRLTDLGVKSSYRMVGNNYVLLTDNRFATYKLWNRKKYDEIVESRSDLVVTNFTAGKQNYSKEDVFEGRDLYSKSSKFTERFWQTSNAIVLTPEEQSIVKTLEEAMVAQ